MHAASTDARLDALDAKVDRSGMKAGFDRVDDRFEGMHRLMVQGAIGLSAACVAGFVALIGLIAAR